MDVFVRAYMDVFTAFAEKKLRREAVHTVLTLDVSSSRLTTC
jgi:hypothetical protein